MHKPSRGGVQCFDLNTITSNFTGNNTVFVWIQVVYSRFFLCFCFIIVIFEALTNFNKNNTHTYFLYILYVHNQFSQTLTPITTENYAGAIETCPTLDPINRMCGEREYDAMPNWDMSNVTSLSEAFLNRTEFNGNISSWDVSNVQDMRGMF